MSSSPDAASHHRDPTRSPMPQKSLAEIRAEIARVRALNDDLEEHAKDQDRQIHQMQRKVAEAQAEAEVSEDNIANRMLRRLDSIRKEKGTAQTRLKKVERERATLMKTIAEVQGQKVELENTIEQEQEFIMHELQKKLMDASDNRLMLERKLQAEREGYLDLLHEQVRAAAAAIGEEDPDDVGSPADPGSPVRPVPVQADSESKPRVSETERNILRLEESLNSLLSQHWRDCDRLRNAEQRCDSLRHQLHETQIDALVQRNHAAKLKAELNSAHNQLAYVQAHSSNSLMERSPSQASSSDPQPTSEAISTSSGSATPVVHRSLQAHTKQILNSAQVMFPVPRRHGSVSPARSINTDSSIDGEGIMPLPITRPAVGTPSREPSTPGSESNPTSPA